MTDPNSNSSILCEFVYSNDIVFAKTLALTVILLLSLTGNLLVINNVLRRSSRMPMNNSTTHVLIMNMAISDLVVPFLAVPREVYETLAKTLVWRVHGPGGTALCKVVFFLTDMSPFVSVFSLCGIAIARFTSVVFPISFSLTTRRHMNRLFIAGTWIVPSLVIGTHFYTFRLFEEEGEIYCMNSWKPAFDPEEASFIFAIIVTVLFYLVPFIVMIALYAAIIHRLRKPPIGEQNDDSTSGLPMSCYPAQTSPGDKSREKSPCDTSQRNQSPSGKPSPSVDLQGDNSPRTQPDTDISPADNLHKVISSQVRAPGDNSPRQNHDQSPGKASGKRPTKPGRSAETVCYNITRLAISVLICFAVCWSPFFLGLLVSISSPTWVKSCETNKFWFVARLMAYSNAAFNPWIYFFFVNSVHDNKRPVRRFLKCGRQIARSLSRERRVGDADETV